MRKPVRWRRQRNHLPLGDRVEEVSIVAHDMQYLYEEGDHRVFMDTESYEQHPVSKDLLGNKAQFLKESMIVSAVMMGTRIIGVDLPKFVELKVVESAVSTRTDTVTAQMKAVRLETGATVNVPTFVKEGDTLKSTRAPAPMWNVSPRSRP